MKKIIAALLLTLSLFVFVTGCSDLSISFDESLQKKYVDEGFMITEFTIDEKSVDPTSKSQGAVAVFKAEVTGEHITVIKYRDKRTADDMERKIKQEIELAESLAGIKILYKRYGVVLASGTSYALSILG